MQQKRTRGNPETKKEKKKNKSQLFQEIKQTKIWLRERHIYPFFQPLPPTMQILSWLGFSGFWGFVDVISLQAKKKLEKPPNNLIAVPYQQKKYKTKCQRKKRVHPTFCSHPSSQISSPIKPSADEGISNFPSLSPSPYTIFSPLSSSRRIL